MSEGRGQVSGFSSLLRHTGCWDRTQSSAPPSEHPVGPLVLYFSQQEADLHLLMVFSHCTLACILKPERCLDLWIIHEPKIKTSPLSAQSVVSLLASGNVLSKLKKKALKPFQNYITEILVCVCVYTSMWAHTSIHAMACVWRSEDNF